MDLYRSRQCAEILSSGQKVERSVSASRNVCQIIQEPNPLDQEDKFAEIKKLYELRIQNLQNSLRQVFEKVVNDPIVETLKRENPDENLLLQRVTEILQFTIDNEKELCIEKLSKQFAILKAENSKLREKLNMLGSKGKQPDRESDYEEVARELSKEIKMRTLLEEEIKGLNSKLKEQEAKYESSVSRRDAQLQYQRELDRKELCIIRERAKELELELDSKMELIESNNKELEKHIREANLLNNRIFELERELAENKQPAAELKKTIEQLQAANQNLKQQNRELNETVINLKTTLEQLDGPRRTQNDRDSVSDDFSMFEATYKHKIRKHKGRAEEYKKRCLEAEAALQHYKKLVEEGCSLQEKHTTVASCRIPAEKSGETDPLSAALERLRSEEQRRTNTKVEKDLQLELQTVKDIAARQVSEARTRVQELEMLLAERDRYINEEYVTNTYHEMKLHEKQMLIEKLKEEIVRFERDRFAENDQGVKKLLEREAAKEVIQLEQELKTLSDSKAIAEEIAQREKEKCRELALRIEECEEEKRKMIECIRESEQINKRLKNVCDENRETINNLKVTLEETNNLLGQEKSITLQVSKEMEALKAEYKQKLDEKSKEMAKLEQKIQDCELDQIAKRKELEKEKNNILATQHRLSTAEKDLDTMNLENIELKKKYKHLKLEHKLIISDLQCKCEILKKQLIELRAEFCESLASLQSDVEGDVKKLIREIMAEKRVFQAQESEKKLRRSYEKNFESGGLENFHSMKKPLRSIENIENLQVDQIDFLQNRNVELEGVIEKTKTHYLADVNILKKEISQIQEESLWKQEQIERKYRNQIDNYKVELSQIKEELRNVRSDYEEQMGKMEDEHEEQLQMLKSKCTELTQELNSYKIKCERLEAESSSKVRQLRTRVEELEFESNRITKEKFSSYHEVRDLNARVEELEQLLLLERRKAQNSKLESVAEIRSLKQQNDELELELSNLNNKYSSISRQRQRSRELLSQITARAQKSVEPKRDASQSRTPEKSPNSRLKMNVDLYSSSREGKRPRNSAASPIEHKASTSGLMEARKVKDKERDRSAKRYETEVGSGSPWKTYQSIGTDPDLSTRDQASNYKSHGCKNSFFSSKSLLGDLKYTPEKPQRKKTAHK